MATTFGTNPLTAYFTQLSRDQKSKTPLQAELGTVGEIAASTAGIAGVQAGAVTQQANQLVTQVALKNAYTTMLAKYTRGQLAIKTQQLGITQLGAQQKQALLGTTTGVEQARFTLSQQQYPEQYALAALTEGNRLKQLQEQAATSGAEGTTTQKRALGTLGERYGFQLADIARAQQTSILGQQATTAKQQYTAQQIANTQKNIELLAQANGLSSQEVITRLNEALTQNKLTGAKTLTQLMTKLGGIWAGEQAAIGTKLAMSGLLASGLNLYAPAQPAPVTSGGNLPNVTQLNTRRSKTYWTLTQGSTTT